MADVTWIKLDTDIFDNRKIKYLRRLPDGDTIVLVWIMLLTIAGRCNSGGVICLTEEIPYSSGMLADEIGVEESTVTLAVNSFRKLGMVIEQDGFLVIADWEEHQNVDGMERIREQNRLRKQRFDAKRKDALPGNVTSNVTVTRSNATDKDIDKEKDIDIKTTKDADFERFWKSYPKKTGKDYAYKCFKKLKNVSVDELIDAVERQKNSLQWQKDGGQYIPNPSTWLNQGRWQDELPETPAAKNTVTEIELPASIRRFV